MKKRLVIAGAGGFGAELLGHVLASQNFISRNQISQIVFIDERPLDSRCGHPVIGTIADYPIRPTELVLLGTGAPDTRRHIHKQLALLNASIATFVHDSVVVGPETSLGEGSTICPGVHITSNVKIGRGCLVNLGSILGHDSSVGEFTVIHPNSFVGGMADLSSGVTIGGSSAIMPGVKIGERAFIGLGSSVIRDVPKGTRVFGNPAREFPVAKR